MDHSRLKISIPEGDLQFFQSVGPLRPLKPGKMKELRKKYPKNYELPDPGSGPENTIKKEEFSSKTKGSGEKGAGAGSGPENTIRKEEFSSKTKGPGEKGAPRANIRRPLVLPGPFGLLLRRIPKKVIFGSFRFFFLSVFLVFRAQPGISKVFRTLLVFLGLSRVAQTVLLVNHAFVPCQKGAVLTKTAKMMNLHSTHRKQVWPQF